MKIAYLIVAYDNPAHFGRLVDALLSPNSMAFVHIDAKSSIEPFEQHACAGVQFIAERNKVYWGDFSFIEALVRLMRQALDSPRGFDYFVLISGTDYPIRPVTELEAFLNANRGAQFVNMVPMPDDAMGKPMSRLESYKPRGGNRIDKLYGRVSETLARAKLVSGKRDYKTALGSLRPYGGSTWWAITREAAQYIVDFIDRERAFVRFYRNTWLPEEGMFHTILGNSPFAANVKRNLLYTDWRAGGRHPKLIGPEHIERFISHPSIEPDDRYGPGELFFARKFSDEAADLVATLRRHIMR